MSQNLSSAAVVIGALLRVNNLRANFFMICVFRYQAQSGFDHPVRFSFCQYCLFQNYFFSKSSSECQTCLQMTKVATSKEFLLYQEFLLYNHSRYILQTQL